MTATRGAASERLVGALTNSSADLLRYFERRIGFDDAADLLAEVMVTAWRRVHALPVPPVQARMWLFGIARHVLENAERGQRRRWRLANTLREASAGTTAGAPADAGLEVRDAIARLEPELAELIRLVHWDGFTISEAAELFDVPASTARSRYQKAKQQLKDALSAKVVERNRTSIS